jgi:hypothetical protein
MLAGCGKMQSSELTAKEVLGFLNGGSPKHMGRCFRLWGKYYRKNNVILVSQQGKYRKTESLIHDIVIYNFVIALCVAMYIYIKHKYQIIYNFVIALCVGIYIYIYKH